MDNQCSNENNLLGGGSGNLGFQISNPQLKLDRLEISQAIADALFENLTTGYIQVYTVTENMSYLTESEVLVLCTTGKIATQFRSLFHLSPLKQDIRVGAFKPIALCCSQGRIQETEKEIPMIIIFRKYSASYGSRQREINAKTHIQCKNLRFLFLYKFLQLIQLVKFTHLTRVSTSAESAYSENLDLSTVAASGE